MDEQLASELNEKETCNFNYFLLGDNDYMIALKLQQQFDQEIITGNIDLSNDYPIENNKEEKNKDEIDPDLAMALMLQEEEEREYAKYVSTHLQPESQKSI